MQVSRVGNFEPLRGSDDCSCFAGAQPDGTALQPRLGKRLLSAERKCSSSNDRSAYLTYSHHWYGIDVSIRLPLRCEDRP
jgi:hypothetical protein